MVTTTSALARLVGVHPAVSASCSAVSALAYPSALTSCWAPAAATNVRAHRLDLLGDLGPHVERAHLRAEAARRADRGEAGDAGADDEHGRRAASCRPPSPGR